jgi:glycosyltransferase involved in cell wall biosynthesis
MVPVVSVIIAAYNSERYIRRSLASALNQTYREIDIIVIDDGSSDRTSEVASSVRDSRVRCFRLDDVGVGAVRNFGIKESRATYVTFMDADDVYLPEKIERQVSHLESKPEDDVCYCGFVQYRTGDKRLLRSRRASYPTGEILRELVRDQLINVNAIMLRRSSILEKAVWFPEGMRGRFAEEWQFYLRLAHVRCRFGYVDQELVVIENRPDSHTSWQKQWIMKECIVAALQELHDSLSKADRVRLDLPGVLVRHKRKLAAAYLVNKDTEKFMNLLAQIAPSYARLPIKLAVRAVPSAALRQVLVAGWKLRQSRVLYTAVPSDSLLHDRFSSLRECLPHA